MSTTTIVRTSFSASYLLPGIARQTSSRSAQGEEKPKNKLRSISDEPTGHSVVETTQPTISESPPTQPTISESPPTQAVRAEHNSPTSIPAAAAARASQSKQSDLLRRFDRAYPSISPSGRRVCRKVLQFILDHSAECAKFRAVGPGDYARLEGFIERSGMKPRLTYIQQERILVVEMPSAMHEVPMGALQRTFFKFFLALPVPENLVNVNVLTNITTKSSIPDLRISLQNIVDLSPPIIVGLGETAFSQSLKSMYTKLKAIIKANPSLLVAMAAVISEVSQYRAPLANSPAWKALLSEPTIRSEKAFLAGARANSTALHQPIIVEDHMWCSVAAVEFKVWVRSGDVQDDNHTIDIDTDDAEEVAEGTFYPTNNMDAVLAMIEKGADAMRKRLIALCQEMQPNFDVRALQDPKIAASLNLTDLKNKLLGAMAETAYERYRLWYESALRPRGKKRNAADAKLGVLDISDSLALGPASNTRSKTLNRKRPRVVGVARRR